jgi:hypothetical protein
VYRQFLATNIVYQCCPIKFLLRFKGRSPMYREVQVPREAGCR